VWLGGKSEGIRVWKPLSQAWTEEGKEKTLAQNGTGRTLVVREVGGYIYDDKTAYYYPYIWYN
jgi:hypothetical protein